jgi:uncharacterized protein (DUF2252 family)
MAGKVEHPSIRDRAERGKSARAKVPRASHAEWSPGQRTHEPLELLAEQATTRVPELVPIRHGRMAVSPFTYYRGAALPMAADLASAPNSGLRVQLCGDAHLSNFGGFASPEREMVFDVNDFDETAPGPFEWDVKRLAASLEVAARNRSFDAKMSRQIIEGAVRSYRQAIREFAGMSNLAVWYSRLDITTALQRWGAGITSKQMSEFQRNLAKAATKDQLKARTKLTRLVDGRLRFISDPPLLVPIDELFGADQAETLEISIREALRAYRRTLVGDRRHLLESYEFADLARKVVGVGSVGTRAWVVLFVGRDLDDTLILQVKEAEDSVLERFVGKTAYANHGQRVVEGQRVMQSSSDLFLGWQRVTQGVDGRSHDYYMRQLWDQKLSANIDVMRPETMVIYAQMCAWTLARAHARSGDAVAIGSYLGSGDVFDRAIGEYAGAYADQNERDHTALVDAIAAGTVPAESGI